MRSTHLFSYTSICFGTSFLSYMLFSFITQGQTIFPGETIKYDVHYGIIHAAQVEVVVDTSLYDVHGHTCYRTEVRAYTKGVVGFFTTIKNTYQSWIDTASGQSHKFVRTVRENNYTLYEITEFDIPSKLVVVSRRKSQQAYEVKQYSLQSAQDVVSAFFYLRSIATMKLATGDTLSSGFFLEDTTYQARVEVLNVLKKRTAYGKKQVYVLGIDFSSGNKGFLSGKNPIQVWVTQDQFLLPTYVVVHTKYGDVEMELTEYSLYTKKKRFKWLRIVSS